MPVTPPRPRFKLKETDTGVRITLPSRKRFPNFLVTIFWLAGSAYALTLVGPQLVSAFFPHTEPATQGAGNLPAFSLLWLSGWGANLAFMFYALLWQLYGAEIITLTPAALTLKSVILGLGFSKEYSAQALKHLRLVKVVQPAAVLDRNEIIGWGRPRRTMGPEFFGIGQERLAFDYGAHTFKFGQCLDEPEARQLFDTIIQRFPQYSASASKRKVKDADPDPDEQTAEKAETETHAHRPARRASRTRRHR